MHKNSKRILILSNHAAYIYNLRKEIISCLLEKGNSIYISSPDGPQAQLLEEMGCVFIKKNFDRHGVNPIKELEILFYYVWLFKKIRPNVMLSYSIKPNIYGGLAAQLCKIPYVPNISGLGNAIENNGLLQIALVQLYRIAMRRAKTIFFQNIENKKFFMKKGIGKEPFIMLSGSGVNLEKFAPLPYPEARSIKFAFVARIMKEKGIDEYLYAAKFIKEKYENTEFYVCGFDDGKYLDIIEAHAQSGIISYYGLVDNMIEIYKQIHCLISPSYHEGMSNVILEAAACGRPVIASDIPGCREAVEDNVSGFLVEKANKDLLVKKIEDFLQLSQNEREVMGLAGRKKVEREFDRKSVVHCYEKVISGI